MATTNFKKIKMTCQAMDYEEKGLTLLETSYLYRSDAKVASKAGYAVAAASLMAKAVKLSAQGHEYLALSKETQEEADKL